MIESIQNRVISFVARKLSVPERGVHLGTTFVGDLHVAGEDGAELLEEFAKEFHVDLSGCDPVLYFGREDSNPVGMIWALIRSLLGQTPEASGGLKPLTVGDLAAAATSGRWIDGL